MDSNLEAFLSKLNQKVVKQFRVAYDVSREVIPSSSITANYVMGGGFPRGNITTIYGNYSAGKSGLMLESVGKAQKAGNVCAYVDVENSFDAAWAERLGVDTKSLILIQKRSSGTISDAIAPLIRAGLDLLVIDSISVIMPEVFLDDSGEIKEFDKRKQIGANARATGMLLQGIVHDNERTAVVLISQTRAADAGGGHMAMKPTGGQAVVFGSSIILKLTSSGTESNQKMGHVYMGDKIHQIPIAREVKIYGEKNKVAPQSRTGTYTFYYDSDFIGIDHVDELVTMAKMYGIVESAGAWTKYDGDQWNGQAKFVEELKNNDELFAKLEKHLNMAMTGEVQDELGGVQEQAKESGQ